MSSNLGFEAQPSRSAIFINNGNPFTRSTGTNYANDPMVSPDSDIETHSTRGWKNPGREVVQGSCYYNNVLYACGCTVVGDGARVIHINCPGVLLGKVRCANMMSNPRYPTIDTKCRNCVHDDLIMSDAKANAPKLSAKTWKTDDMVASFVKLDVEDTSTAPNAAKIFKPGFVDPAVSVSYGLKRPSASQDWNSSPQDMNRLKTLTVPDVKRIVSPPPFTIRHKTVAAVSKTHDAKDLYKANLLKEASLVEAELNKYQLILDEIRKNANFSFNHPDRAEQLQLFGRLVAEQEAKKDNLEIKLELLEKPCLSWHVRDNNINASAEARTVRKQGAEKEDVYYLPRVKGSSNLTKNSPVAVEKKAVRNCGPVVKEISEDGWDMVDEFEDHDWIDVPCEMPKSRSAKELLRRGI